MFSVCFFSENRIMLNIKALIYVAFYASVPTSPLKLCTASDDFLVLDKHSDSTVLIILHLLQQIERTFCTRVGHCLLLDTNEIPIPNITIQILSIEYQYQF